MATLTGQMIANSYKDLLQVSNSNAGVDGTLRTVQDGKGTASALQLSQSRVNVNGIFALNGVDITIDASTINYLGAGAINPSFGTVSVSTGLVVTGYATFAIVSGTSGVFSGIVSATSFAGAIAGTTGNFTSQVSLAGLTASGVVSGTSAVFSGIVSAASFAGDGGSLTNITASIAYNVSGSYGILASLSSTDIRGSTGGFLVKVSAAAAEFSGVVSGTSAVFSGAVSAASFAGAIAGTTGNFTSQVSLSGLTASGIVSGTSAVFSGAVSAASFAGAISGTIVSGNSAVFSGTVSTADLAVSGIVSGNSAVFSGIVSASSFAGAISGTTGVFSSQVSAAGLTLSGVVSGTSGTFSGIVSAASFAGAISGTTGNFSSTVSVPSIYATRGISPFVSLTDGVSIAVDFSTGQNFALTLGDNRTLESGTNLVAGQTGSIVIVQDGTGTRTLSYAANWKFIGGTAPTLTVTPAAIDRLDYLIVDVSAIQAVLSNDVK